MNVKLIEKNLKVGGKVNGNKRLKFSVVNQVNYGHIMYGIRNTVNNISWYNVIALCDVK